MNLAMMAIQKEISNRECELESLRTQRDEKLNELLKTQNHINNAQSELHSLYQEYKKIDSVVNRDTSNGERFTHNANIKDNGPNKSRSVVE